MSAFEWATSSPSLSPAPPASLPVYKCLPRCPFRSAATPVWYQLGTGPGREVNHVVLQWCYSKNMLLLTFSPGINLLSVLFGKQVVREYIFKQCTFQLSKPKSRILYFRKFGHRSRKLCKLDQA